MQKFIVSALLLAVMLLGGQPVFAMQPPDPRGLPEPYYIPPVALQSALNNGYLCGYTEPHAALLEQTSPEAWIDWIEKLSGAEPVTVGGMQRTINNRHSFALFNRAEPGYAVSYGFDYLLETVQAWEPDVEVEVDSYVPFGIFSAYTWKNLIVTIPGTTRPEEVVLLTAHFDSTNGSAGLKPNANATAPGADDNASGSASLLEASRILKDHPLDRTVRLIWFTGEEQGLWGSDAYTDDHDISGVVGVINLDMYAYDSNNDRCFELHVSNNLHPTSVDASESIGQCFVESIEAYSPLLRYDYFSGGGTRASDHASFWGHGIGAIEVGENFYATGTPGGCIGGDMSTEYHQATDTISTINVVTGFDIHRTALGTLFALATLPENSLYLPVISN